MTTENPILVVEDNEDDLYFVLRAFKKAAPGEIVAVVNDGQAALDYLRGAKAFGNRSVHPLPRIVFLDLKLPYVLGLDVLAAIRSEPALRQLPVVILTSSSEDRDRRRAEELGVQGYLVKPATPEALLAALAHVGTSTASLGGA